MADNSSMKRARKLFAPATERNRQPLLDVLAPRLRQADTLLEVASGSGEHAVWLGARMTWLRWLPSDPSPEARASIEGWIAETGVANVAPPRLLDASADDWPLNADELPLDAMLAVNMLHISPWRAGLGLLAGAGRYLRADGLLFLYGPFIRPEFETAASNLAFDADLRQRNREWGLRTLPELQAAGLDNGLSLDEVVEVPANNLILVFRRQA